MGERRKVAQPGRWLSRGKRVGRGDRQIRFLMCLRRDAEPLGEVGDPLLPRKASSECCRGPYPKPTQVVR